MVSILSFSKTKNIRVIPYIENTNASKREEKIDPKLKWEKLKANSYQRNG
jgi:hypothetical protein